MFNFPTETKTGIYEVHVRFSDGDEIGYMSEDRDMIRDFLADWEDAGWKLLPDAQGTDAKNNVWYFVAEEKGDLGMSSPEFKESMKHDIC